MYYEEEFELTFDLPDSEQEPKAQEAEKEAQTEEEKAEKEGKEAGKSVKIFTQRPGLLF